MKKNKNYFIHLDYKFQDEIMIKNKTIEIEKEIISI